MRKSCALPLEFAAELTKIAASGRGGRGVSRLCRPELWQQAALLLEGSRRAAVVSGFYIPEAKAPETDGPCGAVVLARAFLKLGAEAVIWTDELCLTAMKSCASSVGFPEERVVAPDLQTCLADFSPDALIFTERLGRAADGRCYNMRGKDVSYWAAPLDGLAALGMITGVPVVGIGDGGNEAGMGNYIKELSALLPRYKKCLSTVCASLALPVDVSNWGAYALTAALSCVWGSWFGQTEGEEETMLKALRASGAVDGVSLRGELSVDGFPLAEQQAVASSLRALFDKFAN